MRWVKYVLICLFSVLIFACGGVFVFFMPEIRALLRTESLNTTYTLELSATMQIPYERYISAISFEPYKKVESDPSNAESMLTPVLAKITDRIGKERGTEGNLCQIKATPKLHKRTESALAIESDISCTIYSQNLPAYKAMLKEIDYLALKSGLLKIKISAPIPTITQEQIKQATLALRGEILGEIDSSVAFYAEKTQKSCRLVSSHEMPQFLASNRRASGGFTTPEDISLPLDQSEPISLRVRINIACE